MPRPNVEASTAANNSNASCWARPRRMADTDEGAKSGDGRSGSWRSVAVAQSAQKGHQVIDLGLGQHGALGGTPVERRALGFQIGLVGGGQVIGHAAGAVPMLRVADAGGVD